MSASPLLNELRGYGYQIELTGNNLKLIGTGPRPPVELMQRLKALKNEIIAELVKYRQSDPVGNPTPCPVDFGERAAILEYDGGLEREMTEQMAALELGQPVPTQNSDGEKQITIENWRSLIGSLPVPDNHNGRHIGTIALHFLTSSHIVKAIKLGWDELELFGLLDSQHPTAPLRRFDAMGLVPSLATSRLGARLVKLEAERAILRTSSEFCLVYPKRMTGRRYSIVLWKHPLLKGAN